MLQEIPIRYLGILHFGRCLLVSLCFFQSKEEEHTGLGIVSEFLLPLVFWGYLVTWLYCKYPVVLFVCLFVYLFLSSYLAYFNVGIQEYPALCCQSHCALPSFFHIVCVCVNSCFPSSSFWFFCLILLYHGIYAKFKWCLTGFALMQDS